MLFIEPSPSRFRYCAWNKKAKLMGEVRALFYEEGQLVAATIYHESTGIVERMVINQLELLQSTGLVDKNGKEIFMADILEFVTKAGVHYSYEVIWLQKRARWTLLNLSKKKAAHPPYESLKECDSKLKIIGNIYENPELLTSK